MQDDFKIFRNYYEILKKLPANKCGKIFLAMCEYILNDKEPVFSESEWGLAGVFASLKLSLDKTKSIHEARSAAGAQGGRGNIKQSENKKKQNVKNTDKNKSKIKQTESKAKANESKQKANTKQTEAKHRSIEARNIEANIITNDKETISACAREEVVENSVEKAKNIFVLPNCDGLRPQEHSEEEREPLLKKMGRYFDVWNTYKNTKWGDAMKLIIDTVLEAVEYVHLTQQPMLINGKSLKEQDLFNLLNCDEYVFTNLIKRLGNSENSEPVINEPMYILSVLLTNRREVDDI